MDVDHDFIVEPQAMDIDTFGDDGDEDCDGNEASAENEDVNAENEDMNTELRREGAPMDQADEEADEDDLLEKDDVAALRHHTERILVDSGTGPKPCVIVRYTEKHRNSRAESIVTHSKTHDDEYTSNVNVNSERNIWAPFNSKLDWEVARWAKMRGPGSTALSELLAIEGVCFCPPVLLS